MKEQIQKVLSNLQNNKRFHKIESEKKVWFYDSFSHSLISLDSRLFRLLTQEDYLKLMKNINLEENTKILNFLSMINKYSEDKIPVIIPDDKCNVMINTSNRCNLNCSYCYRNKKNVNEMSIKKIDEIFSFIQNIYKPNASEYIISYSMTSESSLDLPLLRKIADRYVYYENYQFNNKDFYYKNISSFYERLKSDLWGKIPYPYDFNKCKKDLITYLNFLLNNSDIFELLQMTYSMFPSDKISDIKNRKNISKWRQVRVNRWCLELYYDEYIKHRKIPYVCFWFMTNGTCASNEFIEFIKASTINPLWVSIDGPEEIHDKNRKFIDEQASYNQIVKNLKVFKDNNIELRASVVLTSLYPKPLDIINHLLTLGFTSFSMTPIRPGSAISFTKENICELFDGYSMIYEELKKQCLQNNYTLFYALKEDMTLAAFNIFTSRVKQVKRCDFGNQIVINAQGDIYPCLYFVDNKDFSYGNIKSVYNGKFKDEEMFVYNRGNCKNCWARYLCGGTCFYGSKISTGNCLKIDIVECMLKKYLAEKCLDLLVFMREHNIDIYRFY